MHCHRSRSPKLRSKARQRCCALCLMRRMTNHSRLNVSCRSSACHLQETATLLRLNHHPSVQKDCLVCAFLPSRRQAFAHDLCSPPHHQMNWCQRDYEQQFSPELSAGNSLSLHSGMASISFSTPRHMAFMHPSRSHSNRTSQRGGMPVPGWAWTSVKDWIMAQIIGQARSKCVAITATLPTNTSMALWSRVPQLPFYVSVEEGGAEG